MYFGCASVLQSIVTSVPDGAPTSWFGTNIIGETVHSSSVRFGVGCVCVFFCVWECVDIVDGSTSRVIRFVWIGSHRICVYMRVLAFWAIRCNAENTWEPKTSLLQFLYIFSNFVIFSHPPSHLRMQWWYRHQIDTEKKKKKKKE